MDVALVATSSLATVVGATPSPYGTNFSISSLFSLSLSLSLSISLSSLSLFCTIVGLPMVLYGIIALLEMMIVSTKRSWMQQRRRQAPRRVLELSRALYEQLDGEMLELLMSNRNFDSNDYERLMRLEAINGRPNVGATLQQIQQLPVVTVTYVLKAFSASHDRLFIACTVFREQRYKICARTLLTFAALAHVCLCTLMYVPMYSNSRASMVEASENASCTVCLSAFQVNSHVRLLPCFHRFHLEGVVPSLLEEPQ
uniref:RING-type domain-containing protein n=1 Tax=Hyaloperonospora arabidopsidis (strain Emoy2) TaxID=559515 RepID=M4BHB3_HYAAE